MIIVMLLMNCLSLWLGYKFGSRAKKIKINQDKN
jgi:hypothetical protein